MPRACSGACGALQNKGGRGAPAMPNVVAVAAPQRNHGGDSDNTPSAGAKYSSIGRLSHVVLGHALDSVAQVN